MYVSGHPILLYIIIIYSICFLIKSKSKNEFLLIFTLFMFMIERNVWQNAITHLTEKPIRTQPTDISLIVLSFYIFSKILFNRNRLVLYNKAFFIFFVVIIVYTFIGILNFGYSAIAEFRSVFYFTIIMLFIFLNVQENEMPYLIKKISSYLIPLILLVPINLLLTQNFSYSVENRQFGALMYQSIVLGFVSGSFYYYYYDKKYKLPLYFLFILLFMVPYTSHRTTWLSIFLMLPFLLYFLNLKKYFLILIIPLLLSFYLINVDPYFLSERLKAFSDISEDSTGSWRLFVWNAVVKEASFWGKGIGARFIVYADIIGWDALNGAHNGYIQILYYTGYFGLFLFSLFLLISSISLLKGSLNKNLIYEEKMIIRLGFVSLISLLGYLMGYGFDIVSIIFISFAFKVYGKYL